MAYGDDQPSRNDRPLAGGLSEFGPLEHVLVKHPREAFVNQVRIDAQWRSLGFSAAPDFGRAVEEYDRFLELLGSSGATIHRLPYDAGTTLDSIYVRDASLSGPQGLILASMGKPQRAGEPAAHGRLLDELAQPAFGIVGAVQPPGCVEGGDLVWLDASTLLVGRGYRTNNEGVRQLRVLLKDAAHDLIVVPLPHWRGHDEVMHLMSLVSPVDRDLAAVYSPLLPVPFRELLLDRGIQLVEVPDNEFLSMGTNLLALSPRRCLMMAGNPRTRAALERAGAEVLEYDGLEISIKGAGGPTCLTRPLVRAPLARTALTSRSPSGDAPSRHVLAP